MHHLRSHAILRAALITAALAGLAMIDIRGAGIATATPADHARHPDHAGLPMTAEAMRRASDAWFAKHPRFNSQRGVATLAAADTFLARALIFDTDNNSSTQVDTTTIFVNESVLFQWIVGNHTVTSGEDSFDPEVGAMFNEPLDSGHPSFAFTYTAAGVYPFFCVIHEGTMRGAVKVIPRSTGVTPIGSGQGRLGFLAPPTPNPSNRGFTMRFAVRDAGRVRAQVFDASGRRVSTVIDRDLGPGAYAATWSGQGSTAPAHPGVYWLRLAVPGARESRRLVVTE